LNPVHSRAAQRQDTDDRLALSLNPAAIKLQSLGSMTLTAEDLKNAKDENNHENHERSQDILQAVMRRRGIIQKARAPFVARSAQSFASSEATKDDPERDDARRVEFTQRIFNRLKERGIHGIRTLRIMMHNMDEEGAGLLPGRHFEGALTHMGIRLKISEYHILLEIYGVLVESEQKVDYVRFLAHGVGNWAQPRLEVCHEAYNYLSSNCRGRQLTHDIMERKFNTLALTPDLCPGVDHHTSCEEFLKQWSDGVLSADGVVSWVDFLDYYLDVSWCFQSHHAFCQYVCSSWNIDMDDWLAKKVFRKYVGEDMDDGLPVEDFLLMLRELDPSIKQPEAIAWYGAIDEDDSGVVDLEEFISSKVLKVKRLFDSFDVDKSGTVDQEEMICILKSLNDSIGKDEALALYQYADLDGNGDISFQEFLENNLLKLLQVFEEFDKNRGGDLNEAEMKQLLRKQDPLLDDYDISQIYKAIDTDGGGSVSFLEFCESQVLRAKMLFDRYDIDKSRALTQFKFRELMLDMDGSLTATHMEAIYNLVADQNSGKVFLGGFLNPNIVKLKLMFDKYDQDKSRALDSDEFKCMLKDLFKRADPRDIEELHRSVCGEGKEITFTMYIQRYKEISRKYDLMQLAKKRKARQKAKNQGLVYK